MTIACQSRLTVTDPVQVPGSVKFRLTLQAGLSDTDADITFIIRDVDNCIHFANRSKMEHVRARVTTDGTVVVHDAQLAGLKGKSVSNVGFEARVMENGAFQCMQLTPVNVSKCTCMQAEGPAGAAAPELEEVVATVVEPRRSAKKRGVAKKGGAKKGAAGKGAVRKRRGRTGNRGR